VWGYTSLVLKHSEETEKLINQLRTPHQVQQWLYSLRYNKSDTMRTINGVVRTRSAHCLEAALATATILEQYGYPPLILDLESADLIDHTLFLYQRNLKFGTVGMSRDIGLHGRKPVYRNLHVLVQSYAAPYIDHKATLTGYGVLDLRTLKNQDWRNSNEHVWFVERALRRMPHRALRLSKEYIQTWRRRYARFKQQHPNQQPNYYPNQHRWS
jgi:hypothetical protein